VRIVKVKGEFVWHKGARNNAGSKGANSSASASTLSIELDSSTVTRWLPQSARESAEGVLHLDHVAGLVMEALTVRRAPRIPSRYPALIETAQHPCRRRPRVPATRATAYPVRRGRQRTQRIRSRCLFRHQPRVRMRVKACLHPSHHAAVRCSPDSPEKQDVSVRFGLSPLVWPDF
jgi:hypothetical protein